MRRRRSGNNPQARSVERDFEPDVPRRAGLGPRLQVVGPGGRNEQKVSGARHRLDNRAGVLSGSIHAGLRRRACASANLQRAESILEVDDFEVPARFVRVVHDDEPLCPSDVQDMTVPLANRLDIVDTGRDIGGKRGRSRAQLDERAGVVARTVHRHAGLARDVFEAVEDPELEGDRCGPGPVAGHQRECKQDPSPHGRHLSRAGTNQRADAIVDADMDVYLLPVGQDRYELYCEVPDEPEAPPETEPPKGVLQRLRRRFADMLAEAERERRHGQSAHRSAVDRGWIARSKARMMRWVAESIGEQRLLWHLRRQTEACLFFPDDVTEVSATVRLRAQLARDRDRHRFWLSIDSVGFVLSGLLMLLPGPNLVAYYFAFRLVGHYLSMTGARRGLEVVRWRTEGSPPLSELRRAIDLEPEQRARHVNDVALKLRLEHLATFFERTAVTAP